MPHHKQTYQYDYTWFNKILRNHTNYADYTGFGNILKNHTCCADYADLSSSFPDRADYAGFPQSILLPANSATSSPLQKKTRLANDK